MAMYDESFDYSVYIDQAEPFEQSEYAQVEGYQELERAYGEALEFLEQTLTGREHSRLQALLISQWAIARCRERHFFARGCRCAFVQADEALRRAVVRLEREEREEEK